MAGHGVKRMAAANAVRLRNLRRGLAGSSGIYALVLLMRFSLGWPVVGVTSAGVSVALGLVALRILSRAGQATYDAQGRVLDGGADIFAKGFYSYTHDVLYLACGCLVLGGLHADFFYLWALVPSYVAYYAATFIIPMLRATGKGNGQVQEKVGRQTMQKKQLLGEGRKAKRAQIR